MNDWESTRDILDATRGIVFFGVPSQGMDIESLLPMAKGQPNESLLHALGTESQLLREQFKTFESISQDRNFTVFCFYETEVSPTARKVS